MNGMHFQSKGPFQEMVLLSIVQLDFFERSATLLSFKEMVLPSNIDKSRALKGLLPF